MKKPSLAKQVDTIKVGSEATGGPYTFEVRHVTNSKFSLYAEADISPRANVIRTIEPLLQEAYADVAGELGMPTVVIAASRATSSAALIKNQGSCS